MEHYQRKSVSDKLRKYCHLSKDSDFIEVTEWHNGEGISISFSDQTIELTYGQLEAINYLSKSLYYE